MHDHFFSLEAESKMETTPSLEGKPMMQPQNKYTYLHKQTLEPHMYLLISLSKTVRDNTYATAHTIQHNEGGVVF